MQAILKRFFPREKLPNITIMGLDAGGKTTLLYKFATSKVDSIIPMIGLYIEPATLKIPLPGGNHQRFTVRAADTGGCARIYPIVRLYMLGEDVSALVWVVDARDADRLEGSIEELDILLHAGGSGGKKENYAPLMPILVLINKVDLFPDRKAPPAFREKFEKLLAGRNFAIFETSFTSSPVSSTGVAEAFAWLADAIAPKNAMPSKDLKAGETTKKVENMVADMRSPAALSAKLEDWLNRADTDPTTPEELLRQFYALDLPSWDHYTHLRLAYTLLLKYGRKEGKDKIFDGFKYYIDKSGKVHGKTFHLTMTYFWVQMVHLGIARGLNEGGATATREQVERNAHSLKATADASESEPDAESEWVLTEAEEKEKAQNHNPADENNFARFLMLNPFLVDGQLWADYYSKEVLMSPQAKEGFQLPDIKKLPDVLH